MLSKCSKKDERVYWYRKGIKMIYGYARISTPKQSIDRQRKNIKSFCKSNYGEDALLDLREEVYSGTKSDRPEFIKLKKELKSGDILIFDSVSRMSRDAAEGIKTYFELFDKGITLIFIKERYIDSDTYKSTTNNLISLTGEDVDLILKGVNEYLVKLAKKQIEIAFWQAQKEVDDLRQRTKEGIQAVKEKGKLVGGQTQVGKKKKSSKAEAVKPLILKYSKDFHGKNNDIEVIGIVKQKLSITLSRNSYYKYKKELAEEIRLQEEKDIDDILQSETI